MHTLGDRSPKCRALLSQLSDYIDGELQEALCAEIERHLAGCEDCRVLMDTTRKTILLYRQQRPIELPTGTLDRLRRALEQAGCGTRAEP